VILGVGELSKRKDFETLIRAFALVRSERVCRLVILGRGRQRDNLTALARELGVGDDVDLAGFQPDPTTLWRMPHSSPLPPGMRASVLC